MDEPRSHDANNCPSQCGCLNAFDHQITRSYSKSRSKSLSNFNYALTPWIFFFSPISIEILVTSIERVFHLQRQRLTACNIIFYSKFILIFWRPKRFWARAYFNLIPNDDRKRKFESIRYIKCVSSSRWPRSIRCYSALELAQASIQVFYSSIHFPARPLTFLALISTTRIAFGLAHARSISAKMNQ